nr:NADH dehydrogenase subunit 6 [Leptomithrax sp. QNL-2021]
MTMLTLPFILTLSFLFTRLHHPLSLGLVLLTQTILISLSSGLNTHSFWFSYILFLIFLGGMLILFIYVASLASNEFFKFSYSYLFLSLSFIFLFTFLSFFLDLNISSPLNSLPISSISNPQNLIMFIISWIYSYSIMKTTLFIIFYLLLTLIVVVKITNLFKGPLRLSN